MRLFLSFVGFWVLFLAGFLVPLLLLEARIGTVNSAHAIDVLTEIGAGSTARVSDQSFVFTFASWIGCAALGFIAAFMGKYGIALPLRLRAANASIRGAKDRREFADRYDSINSRLVTHKVIGSAWREFDETLVKPEANSTGQVITNTVRPGVFLNADLTRSHSFGLKMMPSIPGYFVGVGLLLTFIGLVLALDTAGRAVASENADAMQDATKELLRVASFKFATSIAGLGSSIILGFVFRSIGIIIDGSFTRLCDEVEKRLLYRSPQSISVEMAASLREQRDYLKDITQGDFFQRFGQEFEPRLQNAVSLAMAPVVSGIQDAVGELTNQSRSGTENLVGEFTKSLQQGAGTEMKELAASIGAMQLNLVSMQDAMKRTSEGFGGDMERASLALNTALGQAADTASQKLGSAMDGVLSGIEAHVAALSEAMLTATTAISEQSLAQTSSAASIRNVAESFDRTASNVQRAADPLLVSSSRISDAVEKMEAAIRDAVQTATAEKDVSMKLATLLGSRLDDLRTLWQGYADRFQAIDGELGKALTMLSTATRDQGERLQDYATRVDKGLAEAVDKLRGLLGGLDENTRDLGEHVEDLTKALLETRATRAGGSS